jgi:hypothetical protein
VRFRPIWIVRWGLPLGLIVAGIVLVGRSPEGVAEAVIAAALCVLVANWILRVGFSDAEDRDREEEAREYYDVHGHWPDEPPPSRKDGDR